MAHDVFISHSKKDKTIADAVCAKLESAGIRCWIAPRDVLPGRSFAGEVTRGIQSSKAMVLIFSANSNQSEHVLREVQLAVKNHLHIVQFRIERVVPSDDFAYFLGTPHWLDALTPPLEAHLQRLTASVQALLAPAEPSVSSPAPSPLSLGGIVRAPAYGSSPVGPVSLLQQLTSLWREKKLAVIALAAVLVLSGWWLAKPKKQIQPIPSPPISQATPAVFPTQSVPVEAIPTPMQMPSISESTRAQMRAVEEWTSQQRNPPTVDPKVEVPVKRRFILQHEERVTAEDFSPDSKRLVTISGESAMQFWDLGTGKTISQIGVCQGGGKQVQFSPDGSRILMTDGQGVHLCDGETGKPVGESLGHGIASFSSDGKRVVAMDSDGNITIWDTAAHEQIGKSMRHKGYPTAPPVFSSDGKKIPTIGDDTARIWNAESGDLIGDTLPNTRRATFSPDGKRVAGAPPSSGPVIIWNAQTAEKLFELETVYGIYDIRFSPDGKYILTASQDYSARLWDAQTGKPYAQPMSHKSMVWTAVFSTDGKRIATGSSDGTARLWNAATTQPLSKPLGQNKVGSGMRVHFSVDGKWLLTGSEDEAVRVWEIGAQ